MTEMSDKEYASYLAQVAEMDALLELPDLSREQAERWASLSASRWLLYLDDRHWFRKAIPRIDGRWQLVRMHLPNVAPAMWPPVGAE